MKAIAKALGLLLVRLYYPRIAVSGAPPDGGPTVVVANHPNALLDPLVLRVAAGRPVAFLAKSTFFHTALGRWVMEAFDAIPVYRAHEADSRKNEETFARSAALLAAGGWLALFPEGKSHDTPGLERLKTGAARIALATPGTRVIPAGLFYEQKDIFRSRVSVAFGAPLEIAPDEPVEALTARIAEALGDVVLRAEDREVWRGLVAVAAWTEGAGDVGAVHARAQRLAERYRTLAVEDPAALDALVSEVRHFARMLEAVGVEDPFAIESPAPRTKRALLGLALTAPIAAVGALLGWLPYRAVRPIANALSGAHQDVVSTWKVMLGALILPVAWAVEAVAAGFAMSPVAALLVAVLGPLCGFVALRWDERLSLRREALHARWLALAHAPLADALAARRKELAAAVERALATSSDRARA